MHHDRKWQCDIEEKLQHVQVCIVKAPSGQGKSTLLYRYAFEHLVTQHHLSCERLC